MSRKLFCSLLPFALLWTSALSAMTSEEFAVQYPQLSPLKRAAHSMQICDAVLKLPLPAYINEVQAMGRLWSAEPEGMDDLISTCNTMWTARELDPAKAAQIGRAQKIAAFDLLEAGKASLPVKIRQYIEAAPAAGPRPAPYEVLTGLASSARELDQTLQHNVALAAATLAATGGGLVLTALEATGTLARTSAAWSLRAGAAGMEAALVVTVLSAGVAVGADYAFWWKRESDAWERVRQATARLERRQPGEPLAPLLDEYSAATQRLGYFYSLSLLQADSGQNAMPEANRRCLAKLEKFFAGSSGDWSGLFKRGKVCADAAAVWAGASQYLSRLFPEEPLAQKISNRLMERAKRAYWSYVETEAYRATQPVCVQVPDGVIFRLRVECRDPKTGALVL